MYVNNNTVKNFFAKVKAFFVEARDDVKTSFNEFRENFSLKKFKEEINKQHEKTKENKLYQFIDKCVKFIINAFVKVMNFLLSAFIPKEAEKVIKAIIMIVGIPVCLYIGFKYMTSAEMMSVPFESSFITMSFFNTIHAVCVYTLRICVGLIIMSIPKFIVKNINIID